MRHTITYNGFHGRIRVTVRVDPTHMALADSDETCHTGIQGYVVSRAVARRVNRAVCGCHDCRCGECIAEPTSATRRGRDDIYVIPTHAEIRGNYPQDC